MKKMLATLTLLVICSCGVERAPVKNLDVLENIECYWNHDMLACFCLASMVMDRQGYGYLTWAPAHVCGKEDELKVM